MGYPHRLSGAQIPLFARLLRVADAFSAATTQSSYQRASSTVFAFWEMTAGPYAQFYDPVILKVFQAVVQPYPVGAKVRLGCGRYAVVVRHGRLHGLLPVVIIAFDEKARLLPPRLLEGPYALDQTPEHRIVSYNGEDLTGVYGAEPVYVDDPLDPGAFVCMAAAAYP
jgi:hypothetical protein